MLNYLWVSLGGAIGSVARFWISGLVAALWPDISFRHARRKRHRLVCDRSLRGASRSRGTASRQSGAAHVLHDRIVWRLHDLLLVQPADAEPRSGRGKVSRGRKRSRFVRSLSGGRLARIFLGLDHQQTLESPWKSRKTQSCCESLSARAIASHIGPSTKRS